MDFISVYSHLLSPGSIFVAVVTVIFLLSQAWPRLHILKEQSQQHESPTPTKPFFNPDLAVLKEPEVPAGWWNGREAFELERRAIFSKTWLYLAHTTQFPKPGAYQTFNVSGYPIFCIKGKDNRIRAFHNVCRHRAYTITRKETGASTVLGCRYHGWSYDTMGRLVKAPQFEHLPGFDKSQNGLFEIHALNTPEGFVFVNLDSSQPDALDQDTMTRIGLDVFARYTRGSGWIAGNSLSGDFNWKVALSPRYRESLTRKLEQRATEVLGSSLVGRIARVLMGQKTRAECAIYPATFLYSFERAGYWMAVTCFPTSETTTLVRHDLFSSSSRRGSDGGALSQILEDELRAMIHAIENEFRDFSALPRLPTLSSQDLYRSSTGPLQRILDQMQEHAKLEKTRGVQVLPAMRKPKTSSQFERAEQLCREIDCLSGGAGRAQNGTALPSEGLAW